MQEDCIFNYFRETVSETLEYGDVIFIQRKLVNMDTYKHFGLYVSDKEVIHFSTDRNHSSPYVHEAPMSEFLDGDSMKNIQKVLYPHRHAMESEIRRFRRKHRVGTTLSEGASILRAWAGGYRLFNPQMLNPLYRIKMSFPLVDEAEVDKLIDKLSKITLYSGEETIKRARERIGLQTNKMLLSIGITDIDTYKLASNNCETFAIWCKTGDNVSLQAAVAPTAAVNMLGDIAKLFR